MDLTTVLNNLGLNEKGPASHLAALELGEAPPTRPCAPNSTASAPMTFWNASSNVALAEHSHQPKHQNLCAHRPDLLRDDFRKNIRFQTGSCLTCAASTEKPAIHACVIMKGWKPSKSVCRNFTPKTEILNYAIPNHSRILAQLLRRRLCTGAHSAAKSTPRHRPRTISGRAVQAKDAQSFREIRP